MTDIPIDAAVGLPELNDEQLAAIAAHGERRHFEVG